MRVSFRDPDGYVVRSGTRIFRCVFPHAASDLEAFLATHLARTEIANGTMAGTTVAREETNSEIRADAPAGSLIVEHSPIPFPNFPYEWAGEMLEAAAELTLRVARAACGEGFGLKDATPHNVMFDGARPVFLDVLSFARRDPLDPIWRPYAQFVRTFLYPLMANRRLGLELHEILLTNRDGIEPERMRRMCPATLLMRQPFFSTVTLPAILSRAGGKGAPSRAYSPVRAKDAQEATYLLGRVFHRAERALRSLPAAAESEGTRYAESGHNYRCDESALKEETVRSAIRAFAPRRVLDIGCNTGRFSLMAAEDGARVVAIDRDSAAVGQLWREAARRKADVLPLVIDIARPPGASGWANREHPSFLDRARGGFDCVLMLALAHHLIVNERVPLEAIFELLAELTTRIAVVEYVDPDDSQFQRILRGREELHRDLTPAAFEAAARRWFRVASSREVSPTRRIYTLIKAGAADDA